MLKRSLKALAHGLALALVLPAAALSGLGRWHAVYAFFAQACALAPGLPGDYLRIAYYRWTLRECSLHSRVSFGSFFAQREATLGRGVYIGAYCVVGRCRIGDRTQIASHVEVLSGRRQHARGPGGAIGGSEIGVFEEIEIGADCWIGAAAVVMANVGARTTIGAGAVVVNDVPAGVVAAGVPARVVGAVRGEAGS
jgi:acetyltransferase-like isoleucine patch superfamily enzyme